MASHKAWKAGQGHPNRQIRDLAWHRCLEGSHFIAGENEAQGKDLPLATQLISDFVPKAWALGPDGLVLCASQFLHLQNERASSYWG